MDSKLIKTKGEIKIDKNGEIRFYNSFNPKKFKRFYQITLPKKGLIRAFHGHMKESKVVFPLSGSILLSIVKLSDKKNPSKTNKVKKILLNANFPEFVIIPPGNANGIMSLEKNSSVIFFSDKTLQESVKDDYRFDKNYWGDHVWENE